LPFGKLADIHGRRRIFLLGLAILIGGGAACALAPNFGALITARFGQGIGAGMVYATGIALLSSVFPRERRGAVIGLTTSAVYLGLSVAPLLGGGITTGLGWRAVFAVPLPLVAIAALVCAYAVRAEWRGAAGERLDLPGTAIYAAAMLCLIVGVAQLPKPLAWIGCAMGLAGIVVFFWFERRQHQPVFDVSLFFNNRLFLFSCLASLLMYSATFANIFLISLYLQFIKGMTAFDAGVVLISQPAVQAVFSPVAGRLADFIQARMLASTGMLLSAGGLFFLSWVSADTPIAATLAALVLTGVGFAFFSAPNMSAIMGSVEPRSYGIAGSAASTVRVLGQMFSMAIITLITAIVMGPVAIEPANYPALGDAIRTCFSVAALLCLTGFGLSLARGAQRQGDGH
jgi:MFS family permease